MHRMKIVAAPLALGHCFLELKTLVPWLEANLQEQVKLLTNRHF